MFGHPRRLAGGIAILATVALAACGSAAAPALTVNPVPAATGGPSAAPTAAPATPVITGFARLHGFLVGIVAHHGVLFSDSALTVPHFI